jgi:hypothetical protein
MSAEEAGRKLHELELAAYVAVLEALRSQTSLTNWSQLTLLQTLKTLLHVPDSVAAFELQRVTLDPGFAKVASLNQAFIHLPL